MEYSSLPRLPKRLYTATIHERAHTLPARVEEKLHVSCPVCVSVSVPACVCLLYGGCYWLVFDFIDFHKAAFTTNFASILDTRFNSTRFDSNSTLFASQLEEAAAAAAVKTLGHLHWPSTTFCVAMDQFRTHRTHGLNCKLDMKPER